MQIDECADSARMGNKIMKSCEDPFVCSNFKVQTTVEDILVG